MAYNLISDGVKGTVNLISKGVKAIGSLFNSNRIISFGTVPHRNIERAGDRGSGNNPFLLQKSTKKSSLVYKVLFYNYNKRSVLYI